ncbi:MAG: glycosyltransferase family 4 protein [Candidatus Rokuibacteriota bacterium]
MSTRPLVSSRLGGSVRSGPGVVMYDPGNFTPYYLDSLCRSLGELGASPRVISSPPLFEPVDPGGRYEIDRLFFRLMSGPLARLTRGRTRLRQAIKALGYPAGLWRTWRTLRSRPPGVFHLHWALLPWLDGMLLRGLRGRGWRIVYTVHDPLPDSRRRVAHAQYEWLLSHVDAAIVHTPHLGRQLVGAYPTVGARVHVVPHGGSAVPPPTEADRARARAHLDLEPDRPVLLFFGMIKPYKGLEFLLEAMPGVLAAFPRAVLLIAGEPLMPMRPIRERIERLGLHDSVRLRDSFIPQDEVPLYFAAADALIAPYVDIAASGVVAQAQAFGRAAVVTRVGGLPEFVEPDRCGFVVPPRSPDALAAAIRQALADPHALAEMGRRASRRIGREHDWSDVARQTLAVYRRQPA